MEHSFVTDIAIVLIAAFPLLFLGKRFRIPEVICFLITGIVIGPHALGLIRNAERVDALAEVGVAFILFFIGLKVPLDKIRSMGRTTFISGSLQMMLTVAIAVAILIPLGVPFPRASFYGLLAALGSTAVVLPILATRDEMGAPFARQFLGVSLFQDFAVIPLMLLVPAFASGSNAMPLPQVALRVVLATVGVVVLVLVARVVVPKFLTRIAQLGSREIFTAAAVILIVGTIALAGKMGISAALGAFAAGVVIGDTEFIHEIGGILRPFRDLLSALFFASIGMLLRPAYLVEHLPMVLIVVTIILLVKIAAAYPAFRLGGTLKRTSLRAAFAVAPIGEFSFLLAQEGKKFGVLPAGDEQLFIAAAVLTLGSTPLLVALGHRLAQNLHDRRGDDSETPAKAKLSGHIVVVGFGLNGQNVTRVLVETGIRHVILEEDPHRAEEARRRESHVIVADGADEVALEEAGVSRALAVVIAISDQDGTRRIVQTCRKQSSNVQIVVRTRYVSEVETLRGLGANEVIPEEFETSLEIVTRLLRILAVPSNVVAAQLRILRDEGYRMLRDPNSKVAEGRRLSAILEAGTAQTFLVLPGSPADGKTLEELGVADLHITVPAMIRDGRPVAPVSTTDTLQSGDTLFIVGSHDDLVRVTARLDASG